MARRWWEKDSRSQAERRSHTDYPGFEISRVLLPPNLISLTRLLWAIPAVILLARDAGPRMDIIAGILLGLSFLTDMIDGIVARKFNMISDMGKVLDPLLDKVVVLMVGAALAFTGREPGMPEWLFIAMVLRDVTILALGWKVLQEDRHLFTSSWTGKFTTFAIAVTMVSFIFSFLLSTPVLDAMSWVVFGALIVSSVDYMEKYWSVRHKRT
ncbi:hypothetical protein GF324_13360 [bacterium]|nr:hypothetical protein [bacterium]